MIFLREDVVGILIYLGETHDRLDDLYFELEIIDPDDLLID
jgi:hypothetical protein